MNLSTHIQERNGVKVVDSRKIHAFLGVKTPHRKWIVRQIEALKLENGKDYQADKIVRKLPSGSKTENVFWLTQRSAEHLGMAETNEVGTQIRDAFIAARDARKKQLESEFDRKSKDARLGLTHQWKEHGLVGSDFGRATVETYDVAFGDRDIRKNAMDNRQKSMLTIFELTEALKLDNAPHLNGLSDIKDSIHETGNALSQTFARLRIGRGKVLEGALA